MWRTIGRMRVIPGGAQHVGAHQHGQLVGVLRAWTPRRPIASLVAMRSRSSPPRRVLERVRRSPASAGFAHPRISSPSRRARRTDLDVSRSRRRSTVDLKIARAFVAQHGRGVPGGDWVSGRHRTSALLRGHRSRLLCAVEWPVSAARSCSSSSNVASCIIRSRHGRPSRATLRLGAWSPGTRACGPAGRSIPCSG